MRNFIVLVKNLLAYDGIVVITFLIGDIVHKKFIDNKIKVNQSWDIRENESLKYSIKRLYTHEKLEDAGQKIGILLPFSDGQYYEEYLVNAQVLITNFESHKFVKESLMTIASRIPEFEIQDRGRHSLSTGDREYLSLYGELILRNEKEKK